MKTRNRILSILLSLALLTTLLYGCAVGQGAAEQQDDVNTMLEFPGTHWNDTPEQVIAELGLTEEQILYNDTIGSGGATSAWCIAAEDLPLFGGTVSHVEFCFINYGQEQDPCGLSYIMVCYPEEENMHSVFAAMQDYYGPGSTTPPKTYTILHGQLEEAGVSQILDENGVPRETCSTALYWALPPDGLLTEPMRELVHTIYNSNGNVTAPEVVDAYLDAQPLVQITSAENGTPPNYESFDFFTGNCIIYGAEYWVRFLQMAG